jgi:hypothetical protein
MDARHRLRTHWYRPARRGEVSLNLARVVREDGYVLLGKSLAHLREDLIRAVRDGRVEPAVLAMLDGSMPLPVLERLYGPSVRKSLVTREDLEKARGPGPHRVPEPDPEADTGLAKSLRELEETIDGLRAALDDDDD